MVEYLDVKDFGSVVVLFVDLIWFKYVVFYEVLVWVFFDVSVDGFGDLCGFIDCFDYL